MARWWHRWASIQTLQWNIVNDYRAQLVGEDRGMTISVPPKRNMPEVEFLEPDFARWTFRTDDPALQRAQFNYWRGWYGFEEEDEPHSIESRVWLVRRER